MRPSPPKWPLQFLRWFCKENLLEEIEGDLIELFHRQYAENPTTAKRRFIRNVIAHLRPSLTRPIRITIPQNTAAMIRSYLKVAWRNFCRNKFSSAINVSGLTMGMSVAMLIGLWVWNELSFNKVHTNYDHIVQVMDHKSVDSRKFSNVFLPIPLGKQLRSSFGSDFRHVVMVRQTEEHVLTNGDKKFTQKGNYMEPEGPEMLTLKMLAGSRDGLNDATSIFLSQSLAKKFFGDRNPLDQVITVDTKKDVKVAGIFKDLPDNSDFRTTEFILPFELLPASKDDWNNYNIYIYAQLNDHADAAAVSHKIEKLLANNVNDKKAKNRLFLHPMSKWHLYTSFENHVPVKSEKLKMVWFYGIIGAFVLLLACINFMNLSTAQSERRAREIGVRKAAGSLKRQLVLQFYGESLLIATVSFLLTLLVVQLSLPWFNRLSDKDMSILWTNPWFWGAGFLFLTVTTLLAGSYPALYLSSFNTVRALKGTFKAGKLANIPRQILVVIQFSMSIALMIGTVFVYRQIQYAKERPVGYSKQGLISMYMVAPGFKQKFDVLKTELLNTDVVEDIAKANYPLTNTRGSNGGFYWGGKDPVEGQSFNTISVSQEYGQTVGWQLMQGRDFQKGLTIDSGSIILNQSAVNLAGLTDPVGQMVKWQPGTEEGKYYRIIGVVKDMVKASPFQATEPSVIFLGGGNWLFLRAKNNVSMHTALPKMEAAFKNVLPDLPFDYRFADEDYAAKFAEEVRVGKLAALFSVLAIFISSLGLLGLSSFVAEQRKKEIGVRKVLGASVFGVWLLLSRQFASLVLLACLIAIPVARFYLDGWLAAYSYRVQLSWWVFFAGGIGSLLVALLVVSFQTIKAGSANPIKSLRTE